MPNVLTQTAKKKKKSGVVKSTVHLYGTFKDYLNRIKPHHVPLG